MLDTGSVNNVNTKLRKFQVPKSKVVRGIGKVYLSTQRVLFGPDSELRSVSIMSYQKISSNDGEPLSVCGSESFLAFMKHP